MTVKRWRTQSLCGLALAGLLTGCASAEQASSETGSIPPSISSQASATSTMPAQPTVTSSVTVDTVPPNGGEEVSTPDEAIAIAEQNKAEFGGSTVVRAKLIAYGALLGAESPIPGGGDLPPGVTADQKVWTVAFTGGYTPGYGVSTPDKYTWGCMIIDERTGAALGSFGGFGELPTTLASA